MKRSFCKILWLGLLAGCGGGDSAPPAPTPAPAPAPTPAPTPTPAPAPTPDPAPAPPEDTSFATRFNALTPQPWWRESEPYSCEPPAKSTSPWMEAGITDPGGDDSLSLIRYFGNGSYLRYFAMVFQGCTPTRKYPEQTHLDPPADPSYFSVGDLEIAVDIARIPQGAPGWFEDDGRRETMGMQEAVRILNTHVTSWFQKISEGKLRMRFQAGFDFAAEGQGSPDDARAQQLRLAGVNECGDQAGGWPCYLLEPRGLNRLLLSDVATDTGGSGDNGMVRFGLVSLREANMGVIVHEIGHTWMAWPHSFTELRWLPGTTGSPVEPPNPYSNNLDFMSELTTTPVLGWRQDLPSTMAVNRYAAGWIPPSEVALHLEDAGTYTLQPPRKRGHQFLVIASGRPRAFTTVEVLDQRNAAYNEDEPRVYDPSAPGDLRPFRYQGVLVSRYDQTAGTGAQSRFGPALHNAANPEFSKDVGWGNDDYSVIQDGESRTLEGGIRLRVSRNPDRSYRVQVSGGRTAPFAPWCYPLWFADGEYETGCLLDES